MQFQELPNLLLEGSAPACLRGLEAQAPIFSGSAGPQPGVSEIRAAWGNPRRTVAPLGETAHMVSTPGSRTRAQAKANSDSAPL